MGLYKMFEITQITHHRGNPRLTIIRLASVERYNGTEEKLLSTSPPYTYNGHGIPTAF